MSLLEQYGTVVTTWLLTGLGIFLLGFWIGMRVSLNIIDREIRKREWLHDNID